MKRLFVHVIILMTFSLLPTACIKEVDDPNMAEEMATSRFNAKENINRCAVITGAIIEPVDNTQVRYIISWTNKGGKKFIEVIPEGEESFFINAYDATGTYTWNRDVASPYGEFTFRTITRTGGSPGEGSICEDRTRIIAIEEPSTLN